jgi:hypothetical protein
MEEAESETAGLPRRVVTRRAKLGTCSAFPRDAIFKRAGTRSGPWA